MNKLWQKQSICILFILCSSIINNVTASENCDIKIEQFRVILPPDVSRSTAGYGVIKNIGDEPDTLIKIRSNAATVMLHKTEIVSGMAKMIHMSNMVIEPGSELVFEPMSFHLMLFDMDAEIFREGGEITLFLEFEKAGVIEVVAPIRPSW